MSKWKIFNKSGYEEESSIEAVEIEKEESTEIIHIETEENFDQDDEDKPLAQYNETLRSSKKPRKVVDEDDTMGYIDTESPSDQRFWRNINTIEDDIDNLHKINAQKPKDNMEKTVDELIQKNKKK